MVNFIEKDKLVSETAVSRILCKKFDHKDPLKAAEALASKIRSSYQIVGPLDTKIICDAMNLSIKYKPMAFPALLRETPSGFEVIVNSTDSKVRQRFSISHEIGHIVIYKETGLSQAFGNPLLNTQRSNQTSKIERMCESFASELLMPMSEWKREISKQGISIKVIKRLSSRYKVSINAAARRAVDTEVWNCAIIIWKVLNADNDEVKLNPITFRSNINIGRGNWPDAILDSDKWQIPGSPIYSLQQQKETRGEIPLSFLQNNSKYFAQSSIVNNEPVQIATLIIAARLPNIILDKSHKNLKTTKSKRGHYELD